MGVISNYSTGAPSGISYVYPVKFTTVTAKRISLGFTPRAPLNRVPSGCSTGVKFTPVTAERISLGSFLTPIFLDKPQLRAYACHNINSAL